MQFPSTSDNDPAAPSMPQTFFIFRYFFRDGGRAHVLECTFQPATRPASRRARFGLCFFARRLFPAARSKWNRSPAPSNLTNDEVVEEARPIAKCQTPHVKGGRSWGRWRQVGEMSECDGFNIGVEALVSHGRGNARFLSSPQIIKHLRCPGL